jgi:hypothetical protein
MKSPAFMSARLGLAALAAVAGLVACGGDSSVSVTAPNSVIPATAPGAALAMVSGDTAGSGTTFFNATGQGIVLLSPDGDAPTTVVHVADNTRGRRAPAVNEFVTLRYERTTAQTVVPLTSAVAGSYQTLVGGRPARFVVAADGAITAGSTDCKLSGKIELATLYGGAQAVSLQSANCGTVANGTFSGVVFTGADTAPAAWQLVAENGASVLDVLVYR